MKERIETGAGNGGERLLGDFPAPSLEMWHEEVVRLLRGVSFDKKMLTRTYEGITLKPLYTEADLKDLPLTGTLPGEPPYTRGVHPLGYRDRPWDVAQELPYPELEMFNKILCRSLQRGQSTVNLLLDEATRSGLDPDQAETGQVGSGGTSLATLSELSRALDGVELTRIPITIRADSAFLPVAAMLVALVKERGIDTANLYGSIETDPLSRLASQGRLAESLEHVYENAAALMAWANGHAPHLRTISATGFVWHESGGSAVEELAFTLAVAVEYLRALEKRGIPVDEAAPRIGFGLSAGTHFFMEIAKLRAARTLWSKIVESSGGSPHTGRMTMHVRTSNWCLTAFDPHVNILRGTTAAFSAVAGGCDSLHVNPFDAPLGPRGDLARRLARNTQIILRDESRFDRVVDPAGGAFYVEKLTDQVCREAWVLFQEVEALGGMAAALNDGMPQQRIAATAADRMKNFGTRRDSLVGTNTYPNPDKSIPEVEPPDLSTFQEKRAVQIRDLRPADDALFGNDRVGGGPLEGQGVPAKDPDLFFETMIEAARHGATINQMVRISRRDDDETKIPTPHLRAFRGAEAFERLRCRVHAWQDGDQQTGIHREADVILVCIGPGAEYAPRLEFVRSFFHVAGFRVEEEQSFEDLDEAVTAVMKTGAPIICIVSTDARYRDVVPGLAARLERIDPPPVVCLAGLPGEYREAFDSAGVNRYIHFRTDAYSTLSKLARRIGVMS